MTYREEKSDSMSTTTLSSFGSIRRGEYVRKLLHSLPGLLPFVLAAVPHPDPLDWVSLTVVITLATVLTGVFLASRRIVQRDGEDNLLSTTLSYPATVCLLLVLFPGHAEFAGALVTILAFGDTAAYFGGKTLGRTKLPWNTDKSWAGLFCFVAAAFPTATLALYLEARDPSVALGMAAACGFAGAVTGALVETLPMRLTDNLRIGVGSGIAIVVSWFALAPFFAAG